MNNHENPKYSENKIEQSPLDRLKNLFERSQEFTQANYDCYSFSDGLNEEVTSDICNCIDNKLKDLFNTEQKEILYNRIKESGDSDNLSLKSFLTLFG